MGDDICYRCPRGKCYSAIAAEPVNATPMLADATGRDMERRGFKLFGTTIC